MEHDKLTQIFTQFAKVKNSQDIPEEENCERTALPDTKLNFKHELIQCFIRAEINKEDNKIECKPRSDRHSLFSKWCWAVLYWSWFEPVADC